MPINIPSNRRARAFLWLVYHYLEDPTSSPVGGPTTNPFADDYSGANPGKVPLLPRLSPQEMQTLRENIDTREEVGWGEKMCALRTAFLQQLVKTTEDEKRARGDFASSQSESRCIKLIQQRLPSTTDISQAVLQLVPPTTPTRRPRAPRQIYVSGDTESGFRHYAPQVPPDRDPSPSMASQWNSFGQNIVTQKGYLQDIQAILNPHRRSSRSILNHGRGRWSSVGGRGQHLLETGTKENFHLRCLSHRLDVGPIGRLR